MKGESDRLYSAFGVEVWVVSEDNGGHSVSPKKIEANRRNAQRSTGPRTPEGKARSRRNALKHGILASAILIKTGPAVDNADEFNELMSALRDDLAPEGALEDLLVEKIAVCYWRQRRALQCEAGMTAASLKSHLEIYNNWKGEELSPEVKATLGNRALPVDRCLDQILRYETSVHRQLVFAINQLERLQRARKGEHVPAPVAVHLANDQ
jgi:hypothetical protein